MSKQYFGSTWQNYILKESKGVIVKPDEKKKVKPEYLVVKNGKKIKLFKSVGGRKN